MGRVRRAGASILLATAMVASAVGGGVVGPADAAMQPAQALFSGETLAAQVVTSARDETSTQCLAVVELRFCSDLIGTRPGGSDFVPADLPYTIPAPAPNDDSQ